MKRKTLDSAPWIWRTISTVSILATLLLLFGFGYAIKDVIYPEGDSALGTGQSTKTPADEASKPEAPVDDGKIRIAVIGDSLARGTGDDEGLGFVRRAGNILKEQGHDVQVLNNLGVNGLRTDALLSKLDEQGVRYVLQQSNFILLSIGANDLFQGGQVLQGEDPPSAEKLAAVLPETSKRLQEILKKVKEINPEAQIAYIGLYNPFGDVKELEVPGNAVVAAWNDAALQILNQEDKMTLVPTFDLFENHLGEYLSSDHFHPNGAGYEEIAVRIAQEYQAETPAEGSTN
ncbi:GDSL-type esterase/lipase family protein [Paenibacillus sp. CC-CFT742]|uniref:GDSL-type esterase/lipase family protein n=1 Tax=Paenibacillus illinoisensis TaxID=59845 RepID=UPI002041403F|nr:MULTISPECIES: GDSL-type esterase/lipase family protein [Paenibacillus]MCM3207789.1 GDSL-type esterase/lipase family protein [Paenibacillus illinoisensis]WJH28761.1 GDSL-type esterase/lipase family protein [Paenibacillus sp. CC-CFT742]